MSDPKETLRAHYERLNASADMGDQMRAAHLLARHPDLIPDGPCDVRPQRPDPLKPTGYVARLAELEAQGAIVAAAKFRLAYSREIAAEREAIDDSNNTPPPAAA